MKYSQPDMEKHIRVYEDRSEYHVKPGKIEIFKEGAMSNDAKKRLKIIKDAFDGGFLDSLILDLKSGKTSADLSKVSGETQDNLRNLVDLVTSEVGRALIGLTVMQLSIKSISPGQSIRLHKASSSNASFSWAEGVSMRTLDKNYVTPVLRKHDLVRLNADGFMMTRSLAENYPYSSLYKAQLKGARDQWLAIVEELETGKTNSLEALRYFIGLLLNAATAFTQTADELVDVFKVGKSKFSRRDKVIRLMKQHAESSDYAARLLEISMHALFQAAVESGALGDVSLKPLSQMRSANKKHGNVGDIELLEGAEIVEAWDAKYGKAYLREEVEEVADKIPNHDGLQLVGFVTSGETVRNSELDARIREVCDFHRIKFEIIPYPEWIDLIFKRCLETDLINEQELSIKWLEAYVLTLAQRKREIAPVDEPCIEWIRLLKKAIANP